MGERSVPTDNRTKAPCRLACPAGIDVPRYIRQVRKGNFDEALAVIRERIPFPFVCGMVCYSPCENQCTNRLFGEPVAIRALKRSSAERGGELWRKNLTVAPPTGKTVAVVGSGPSGLTAAYYLALRGHRAIVFEAIDRPGGMMRTGIPAYRLPREALDGEIDDLKGLGVEIKTGKRIRAVDQLLGQGYDAVFLGCGLEKGAVLGIEGEDCLGVVNGIAFLRRVNGGLKPGIGRRVAVIGGGNTAVDAARSAIRLGAEDVSIVYRRSQAEMTAYEEEIEAALMEGVRIEYLLAPIRIEQKPVRAEQKEAALAMTFIRMQLGDLDGSGRHRPVPIAGSEFNKDFDSVITAVGQAPEGVETLGVGMTRENLVEIDPDTLATDRPGVFAGGDLVSGPASIIDAIAHGRKAAASIDRFLGGDGNIDQDLAPAEESVLVAEFKIDQQERQPMPCVPPAERISGFIPVEIGLTPEAAVAEANRCKDCDVRQFEVTLYGEGCKECGYCMEVCRPGVFGPAEKYNEKGYRPMEVKHQEKCVGCELCFYACPDFSIDIKEVI